VLRFRPRFIYDNEAVAGQALPAAAR
jgi:hypothetical protein